MVKLTMNMPNTIPPNTVSCISKRLLFFKEWPFQTVCAKFHVASLCEQSSAALSLSLLCLSVWCSLTSWMLHNRSENVKQCHKFMRWWSAEHVKCGCDSKACSHMKLAANLQLLVALSSQHNSTLQRLHLHSRS